MLSARRSPSVASVEPFAKRPAGRVKRSATPGSVAAGRGFGFGSRTASMTIDAIPSSRSRPTETKSGVRRGRVDAPKARSARNALLMAGAT